MPTYYVNKTVLCILCGTEMFMTTYKLMSSQLSLARRTMIAMAN